MHLQYDDKFGTCVCICVYPHQATADIRAAEVKRGAKSQLTIIGVTGATSKDDEIKCRNAGMTDIIAKPVKREHLRTKIKVWVDKMEKVHFGNSKPSILACSSSPEHLCARIWQWVDKMEKIEWSARETEREGGGGGRRERVVPAHNA